MAEVIGALPTRFLGADRNPLNQTNNSHTHAMPSKDTRIHTQIHTEIQTCTLFFPTQEERNTTSLLPQKYRVPCWLPPVCHSVGSYQIKGVEGIWPYFQLIYILFFFVFFVSVMTSMTRSGEYINQLFQMSLKIFKTKFLFMAACVMLLVLLNSLSKANFHKKKSCGICRKRTENPKLVHKIP